MKSIVIEVRIQLDGTLKIPIIMLKSMCDKNYLSLIGYAKRSKVDQKDKILRIRTNNFGLVETAGEHT